MLRALAILTLIVASSAFAGELAITGRGERIVDRDPSAVSSNCFGWVYNPWPMLNENGDVTTMYTVSDEIAGHCKVGIESPFRFGDTIRLHTRNDDGSWSGGITVIDRNHFSWMSDAEFLTANPESYVGHLSSPAVVRAGGRFFMAFVASVNDMNLCAGEHHSSGTECGSCRDPWSYFVVMWAVSDDGVNWRVRERSPGDAVLLGREPDASDFGPGLDYKGIPRVTMLTHEEDGRLHFYIAGYQWTGINSDSALFRIPYDPNSEWGISNDPEMWSANSREWLRCEDGKVPDLLRLHHERSIGPFSFQIGRIARTTIFGQEEYIALSAVDSWSPGRGLSNALLYARSTNLRDWTPARYVMSALPFFGDTYGYDASMLEPAPIETGDGVLRLFVASADGDDRNGLPRDGRHDCSLGPELGPTAPYVGTGIYEATLALVDPSPTVTTIDALDDFVRPGAPARFRVSVTSEDGSVPQGMIHVANLDHYAWASARLVNGSAEIALPIEGRPPVNRIYAYFTKQGVWEFSRSEVIDQRLHATARRRAVGR